MQTGKGIAATQHVIEGLGLSCPILYGEPMRDHTTFRIGGPADVLVCPGFPAELGLLVEAARREAIPFFVLGGGANILVADRGIRGLVIDMAGLGGISAHDGLVTAGAGATVSEVSEFAAAASLEGMEFIFSMPGSVGGAVWMNARCFEREIADVLHAVTVLTSAGDLVRRVTNADDFAYKRSPFQSNEDILLEAEFRLREGEAGAIRKRMEAAKAQRVEKGHFLYPCAGSVFKNTRSFGEPVGRILDALGFKGKDRGGAAFADFHANFIVNKNGASADDVLFLMRAAEEAAWNRRGLRLEREILLVGDWPQPAEAALASQ